MAFQIKIKPISKWIGTETKSPGYSQFKQTYSNTKVILQNELAKLHAIEATVQLEMFIRPEDLRADGELRANVKVLKPGVVLSFSKVKKRFFDDKTESWKNELQTLSYPCDTYNDWQDNLRAIALSLEALRKVARYGVFKYEDMISRLALPSAEGKVSGRELAIAFLAEYSQFTIAELASDTEKLKRAYKFTLQILHPDKGGSHEHFLRLQNAKEILGI